ncbi:MAG: hypothetical protein JXA17_02035, partial [Dehalococcoidales bacterium]|nr:hypothetical protein [Dehalococcoidales bacterium]
SRPRQASRAILSTFIESLEVDDGEITFNYGLPPDGAKQETVSVLGIVPLSPLILSLHQSEVLSVNYYFLFLT